MYVRLGWPNGQYGSGREREVSGERERIIEVPPSIHSTMLEMQAERYSNSTVANPNLIWNNMI